MSLWLRRCLLLLAVQLAGCGDWRDKPVSDDQLEIVAKLKARPGSVAVSADGRVFISLHPFDRRDVKVSELTSDGGLSAFPNAAWNAHSAAPAADRLHTVWSLKTDNRNGIWILDDGVDGAGRKLVGWNLQTNMLQGDFLLDELSMEGSLLNDFAIDPVANVAYIADTGAPAIIVVDLTSGSGRRVIFEDGRLHPEDVDIVVEGVAITTAGEDGAREPVRLGINPITLSADNAYWL